LLKEILKDIKESITKIDNKLLKNKLKNFKNLIIIDVNNYVKLKYNEDGTLSVINYGKCNNECLDDIIYNTDINKNGTLEDLLNAIKNADFSGEFDFQKIEYEL